MATAPPSIWILGGNVKDIECFVELLVPSGRRIDIGPIKVISGEYLEKTPEKFRFANVYACETLSFSTILKLTTKKKQRCDAFIFLNSQKEENQAITFVKTVKEWSRVFTGTSDGEVSVPIWILNFREGSTDCSVWVDGLDEKCFDIFVKYIIDIDQIDEGEKLMIEEV